MVQPDLFTRMKEARSVRVVVVYLGASWVVLQVAEILQQTVGLPEWVMGFVLLLLLIGLVIILATAWVQAPLPTATLEEAGEVPTGTKVAPGSAVSWASPW